MIITAVIAASCGNRVEDLPLYLQEDAPVDERVEDALLRLTLDEKIDLIHAQSKFSSKTSFQSASECPVDSKEAGILLFVQPQIAAIVMIVLKYVSWLI